MTLARRSTTVTCKWFEKVRLEGETIDLLSG